METLAPTFDIAARAEGRRKAHAASWRVANLIACVILMVAGAMYVAKTWSPSSYGHVLVSILGYADAGPDWSRPRGIRSDEYAVLTPFIQATINNDFERFNRTSLYRDDLRSYIGLPLRDWALFFKPTMWLYGLVNPAYAYSAHWLAVGALFIFGYAWLFRWFGASAGLGYSLSLGLFFTGFVQFWWTMLGPALALFPWTILPFATRLPLAIKAGMFWWVAVAWLLIHFYPPVQVSLAFVGLILLLAREPDLFKPRTVLVLGLAALCAAATVALYLSDYLQATAATFYPGGRTVSGGTVPWRYWLSWVLPAVNFNRGYENLVGPNICEVGTVGLYYFLLSACFLDYRGLQGLLQDAQTRRRMIVVGTGLAMLLAWMALPLPSWTGAPLLWNRVQPERMQFAGGLTLLCFLVIASQAGFKPSLPRLLIFCGLTSAGWWLWKHDPSKAQFEDVYIVVFAAGGFALARAKPNLANTTFAVISLLAGVLLFGRFNPLQSAWPIFNRDPNPMTRALDRFAAANDGVLAVMGLPGATANGLGYRSLSHVTMVPDLTFWRKQFPDMPQEAFLRIFNRYSHIVPSLERQPRMAAADSVTVPISRFQKSGPTRYAAAPAPGLASEGVIDRAWIDGGDLVLHGWAAWTGPVESHALEITVGAPTAGDPMRVTMVRPDLPAATAGKVSALNGFVAKIPLALYVAVPPLCVVAHDTSNGARTLLRNPPNAPACQGTQIATAPTTR